MALGGSESGRSRETNTAGYLLGTALLPNYIEDALSAFDGSCGDFEEREVTGVPPATGGLD
ncbi:hypothetical protein K9U39_05040 [Rhodoblastus acidophilus]|uniref:Uncharacterized protein n=1 Tax=Candidatus Rhodoblastus alkanivorans TaxID=2954117 RepID=A0ABS9Z5X4_9HYPH|nr:hypothetical protein [Candidatus Rhodoblastus alkanivorans]MCI4678597.1 hypothetical protein [Candidatus Rhodoblastus alkanivorans]MCI4683007.1 hypothetical protein [Candidatus Rhodoblastus alkanivorans]MDI4640317.1 hypothetical protein [Rhodoblastus acidophilus]